MGWLMELSGRVGCCSDSSVVDWDSVEKEEEGGSAGTAHSERTDGSGVVIEVVDVVSAVVSSKM